jgi:predicted ATP-grasp superfamily ATP-dependent carboligase
LRGQAGYAWTHAPRDVVPAGRSILDGTLAIADHARSLFGPVTFAAYAADDPWPAIADLPVMAGRLLTRRFGRTRILRRRAAAARNRPATSI